MTMNISTKQANREKWSKKQLIFLVFYFLFRILPEIILVPYLLSMVFMFLPFVSLGIIIYNIYFYVSKKTKQQKKNAFAMNMGYAISIILIGLILFVQGNFGAHHAPIFFIIGGFFGILEIVKKNVLK